MGKALDAQLIDWMRKRIRLACDVRESFDMARTFGYDDDAIAAGIEAARPLGSVLDGGPMQLPPLIRRAPDNLRNIGAPQLDLYTLTGFLKPKQCERLIALIGHHLGPSTVSSDPADRTSRVSQTALLCFLRSPLATEIDDKICRTLGINSEFSEGIQAQRYEVGGHFMPHYDFFGPESDPQRSACSVRGNRTWTFMVYLNDDLEGGATRFTDIDRMIRPTTGMAVLWNNLHVDGTPNLAAKHCGEPVTRGHKIIITKWFRVRGHGPLFAPEIR
jgi:prolyl 4-hydroxylase